METRSVERTSVLQAGPRAAEDEIDIRIETRHCIACGGCTCAAPSTFIVNDALIAELTGERDDIRALMAAVDACPLFAITLHTPDGALVYPLDAPARG